jgi:hypothetical protein
MVVADVDLDLLDEQRVNGSVIPLQDLITDACDDVIHYADYKGQLFDFAHDVLAAGRNIRVLSIVDESSFPGLGAGVKDRNAAYPARQADAERAGGEFPWPSRASFLSGQL